MIQTMYNQSGHGMWRDGVTSDHVSFHPQHYLLWLGITPEEGVATTHAYLTSKGMEGSTYSANSLLHGLYNRAAGVDYGQTGLELMTQCGKQSVRLACERE